MASQSKSPKPSDRVTKDFTGEVSPVGERTIRVRVTTSAADRMGDTIQAAGWDLGNYLKNPTVQWAHDYSLPPIGRTLSIKQDVSGLTAEIEFVPKGMYPLADTVCELTKAGFINATSVGFNPTEWELQPEGKGFNFLKQELLEISMVPIPANPQCLIEARAAGIDLAPVKAWATKALGEIEKAEATPAPVEDERFAAIEAAIKAQGEAFAAIVAKLDAATTEPAPAEPVAKAEPVESEGLRIVLEDGTEAELTLDAPDTITFDDSDLKAALEGAISVMVREAVTEGFNRAAGRVD